MVIHLNMLTLSEPLSKLLKRKLQINKNVFITSSNTPEGSQENWFRVAITESKESIERTLWKLNEICCSLYGESYEVDNNEDSWHLCSTVFSHLVRNCCNVMEHLQHMEEMNVPSNLCLIMMKLRFVAWELQEQCGYRAMFPVRSGKDSVCSCLTYRVRHQTFPLSPRADILEEAKLLLLPSVLPQDQPHQQLITNSTDGPLHRETMKSHAV